MVIYTGNRGISSTADKVLAKAIDSRKEKVKTPLVGFEEKVRLHLSSVRAAFVRWSELC